MQSITLPLMMFMSVLFPSKLWYAPEQPLTVTVRDAAMVRLVMTDFSGKPIEPVKAAEVAGGATVDVRDFYPETIRKPGTYVLWAVPPGKPVTEFVGTPLLIAVRSDGRRDAPEGAMVIRVEPLRYAVMETDQGSMTMAFYYDVAPNTVNSFLSLSLGGFYDGLTFHRVVPGFVIQGGDPRGDGSGGPGYTLPQEFNTRAHLEGVLSMAREGDPIEAQGQMPRPDAANSAGSQFFICLSYARTRKLDGRYTAYGVVTDGMDTVNKIAALPIADTETGRPTAPTVIKSVRVLAVDAAHNPYTKFMNFGPPTTAPSTLPVAEPAKIGKP